MTRKMILLLCLFWIVLCPFLSPAFAASDAAGVLQPLLGIPYRDDGTIDDAGRYTLFADRTRLFPSPGLNCSGFVLQGARLLLGRPLTLDAVTRDRLGDSGPGAALGQDWDFGWDLIMNIAEGLPCSMLLPDGQTGDLRTATGKGPRGYDIHAAAFWAELPGRIRPGYLYLASFSKDSGRRPYALLHYHVGLFIRAADGTLWYYHTTHGSGKSFRMNLSTDEGRNRFLRSFSNTGKVRKMLLLLELPLPG